MSGWNNYFYLTYTIWLHLSSLYLIENVSNIITDSGKENSAMPGYYCVSWHFGNPQKRHWTKIRRRDINDFGLNQLIMYALYKI